MKKTQSGFTLIELLVVIAIIGILATIVLTSLGSARTKATDAKVQAQLSSMRAQAELYYSSTTTGNYGAAGTDGTCSGAGDLFIAGTNTLYNLLSAIPSGYTTSCYTNDDPASAWAVTVVNTPSSLAWCVDSTGQSKTYNTTTTPAFGGALVSTAICQ